MNYINGENLMEFEIFNLAPIGWPTMDKMYGLIFGDGEQDGGRGGEGGLIV